MRLVCIAILILTTITTCHAAWLPSLSSLSKHIPSFSHRSLSAESRSQNRLCAQDRMEEAAGCACYLYHHNNIILNESLTLCNDMFHKPAEDMRYMCMDRYYKASTNKFMMAALGGQILRTISLCPPPKSIAGKAGFPATRPLRRGRASIRNMLNNLERSLNIKGAVRRKAALEVYLLYHCRMLCRILGPNHYRFVNSLCVGRRH